MAQDGTWMKETDLEHTDGIELARYSPRKVGLCEHYPSCRAGPKCTWLHPLSRKRSCE
jgi:hypothetical protein